MDAQNKGVMADLLCSTTLNY